MHDEVTFRSVLPAIILAVGLILSAAYSPAFGHHADAVLSTVR
jgi:hypothetical protein